LSCRHFPSVLSPSLSLHSSRCGSRLVVATEQNPSSRFYLTCPSSQHRHIAFLPFFCSSTPSSGQLQHVYARSATAPTYADDFLDGVARGSCTAQAARLRDIHRTSTVPTKHTYYRRPNSRADSTSCPPPTRKDLRIASIQILPPPTCQVCLMSPREVLCGASVSTIATPVCACVRACVCVSGPV